MPAWIRYGLLRIGLFAAVLALLLLLGVVWWLATLWAAIVGFAVGYLFFPRLRQRAAEEWTRGLSTPRERRRVDANPARPADEDVEDDALGDR